jgi:hypothetical protein
MGWIVTHDVLLQIKSGLVNGLGSAIGGTAIGAALNSINLKYVVQ